MADAADGLAGADRILELLAAHPARRRLPDLIEACLGRQLERDEDLREVLELARALVEDVDGSP